MVEFLFGMFLFAGIVGYAAATVVRSHISWSIINTKDETYW